VETAGKIKVMKLNGELLGLRKGGENEKEGKKIRKNNRRGEDDKSILYVWKCH
jgi:hypothetical protein